MNSYLKRLALREGQRNKFLSGKTYGRTFGMQSLR